jgi:hypothetical protein
MSSAGLPDPTGHSPARPSRSTMPAPRPAARTARGRAGRRPKKAKPGRRRMPSSTACARRSISCCPRRTPPSSRRSRRPSSRSWRQSARCRPCRAAGRGRRLAAGARRSDRDGAVPRAPGSHRRARARPDQGRQRHALVRDLAALSRRGDGRVLARAAHAQGAPGRAGARGCSCPRVAPAPDCPAAAARPTSATKRTRALPPAPARHADPRAQPRSARVAGDLAAERTRADARQPAPAAVERAGARTIRRTRPCRNDEVGGSGPRA